MHGDALAAAVVQRWPQTRIVFMSGHTDDATSFVAGSIQMSCTRQAFHRRDLAQILRLALDGLAGSSAA